MPLCNVHIGDAHSVLQTPGRPPNVHGVADAGHEPAAATRRGAAQGQGAARAQAEPRRGEEGPAARPADAARRRRHFARIQGPLRHPRGRPAGGALRQAAARLTGRGAAGAARPPAPRSAAAADLLLRAAVGARRRARPSRVRRTSNLPWYPTRMDASAGPSAASSGASSRRRSNMARRWPRTPDAAAEALALHAACISRTKRCGTRSSWRLDGGAVPTRPTLAAPLRRNCRPLRLHERQGLPRRLRRQGLHG